MKFTGKEFVAVPIINNAEQTLIGLCHELRMQHII
jgi:hypothetical protein